MGIESDFTSQYFYEAVSCDFAYFTQISAESIRICMKFAQLLISPSHVNSNFTGFEFLFLCFRYSRLSSEFSSENSVLVFHRIKNSTFLFFSALTRRDEVTCCVIRGESEKSSQTSSERSQSRSELKLNARDWAEIPRQVVGCSLTLFTNAFSLYFRLRHKQPCTEKFSFREAHKNRSQPCSIQPSMPHSQELQTVTHVLAIKTFFNSRDDVLSKTTKKTSSPCWQTRENRNKLWKSFWIIRRNRREL